MDSFSFGDNPALADELAELVLARIKTATCWAAGDGMQTEVGKRMIVVSGSGRPPRDHRNRGDRPAKVQ